MGVGVEYAWPYQPAYSHSHSHSQIGGQTDVFGREAREAREEDREEEHSANEAFFRRGSSRGGGGQGVNASGSGANVLGGKEKFSFERDAQTCDDSGEEEGSVVTNLATRKGSERSLSVYSQISLDKANADDVLDLGYKAGEVKLDGEMRGERAGLMNDNAISRVSDVRDGESTWSTQAIVNGKTAVKKEVKSLRSISARFGNLRGVRSRVATRTASLGDSLAKTMSSLNIKKARSVKTGEDGQERLKARRVSTGSAGDLESGMLGGNVGHGPGGSVAEGGSAENDRGSRQSSGESKLGSRRRQRRVY